MKTSLKIILSVSLLLLSACSTKSVNSAATPTLGTAATGAAVGGGIGAIVGAVITDGVIAESALLGAGIGIPVAIAGKYVYYRYKEDGEIDQNNYIIKENYEVLTEDRKAIDHYRQQSIDRIQEAETTADQSRHYLGNTIGY